MALGKMGHAARTMEQNFERKKEAGAGTGCNKEGKGEK
jgi:hypothetical protein